MYTGASLASNAGIGFCFAFDSLSPGTFRAVGVAVRYPDVNGLARLDDVEWPGASAIRLMILLESTGALQKRQAGRRGARRRLQRK